MNKKLKKTLAIVSVAAMCALNVVTYNAFAAELPIPVVTCNESDTPMYRIIQSYDKPYITHYEKGFGTVIAMENEKHVMNQNVCVYINMKDGKTLRELDIENAEIHIAEVDYQYIKYRLTSENKEAEMKAVEALSKCDEVLSVDKVYTVFGEPAWLDVSGAWVKVNEETKDILSEYEFSDNKYILGWWKDNTPIFSDEHKCIHFHSDAERYAFMKKMQDNNIEYELSIGCTEDVPPIIAEETVNLYTSPDCDLTLNDNVDINSPEPTLLGDANEDGKVSIADAVSIMQALSNPDKFQLTPQGMANADIVGDGDGITVMDALKIQEMEINK